MMNKRNPVDKYKPIPLPRSRAEAAAADLIEQQQQRIEELESDWNSEHYHRRAVDEENEHLKVLSEDHERLHNELAKALNHDAEAPSLCDLVAVARLVVKERDELAATVERLRDYIERGSPYNTNPSKCERNQILAATPQQNLAEVRAKAVEDAIKACPSKGLYRLPLVDTCELYEYANQLKQGER